MDVNNGLRRIDYLPMIAIRSDSPDMLLSERTHTMANNIQSVSNIAMPKVFSCALSMTYGALMATATYTGSKVITAFVYNLNDPLPLSESEYRHLFWKTLNWSMFCGTISGAVTGLSAAAVLKQCIDTGNRHEYSANYKSILFGIGGAVGVSFGTISGAIYCVALNHLIADHAIEK